MGAGGCRGGRSGLVRGRNAPVDATPSEAISSQTIDRCCEAGDLAKDFVVSGCLPRSRLASDISLPSSAQTLCRSDQSRNGQWCPWLLPANIPYGSRRRSARARAWPNFLPMTHSRHDSLVTGTWNLIAGRLHAKLTAWRTTPGPPSLRRRLSTVTEYASDGVRDVYRLRQAVTGLRMDITLMRVPARPRLVRDLVSCPRWGRGKVRHDRTWLSQDRSRYAQAR